MRKLLIFTLLLALLLLLFGCAPPGYTFGEDGQLSPADAGGQQAGDDFNWYEDLCSGEWHYDHTEDRNIEIEGTEFEDIASEGHLVSTFSSDGTVDTKLTDRDSGEIIWHNVYQYYVHEHETQVYFILGETLEDYSAYEFNGEVYEVYAVCEYKDGGSLYNTMYFVDDNNVYHLISNTNVFVKK